VKQPPVPTAQGAVYYTIFPVEILLRVVRNSKLMSWGSRRGCFALLCYLCACTPHRPAPTSSIPSTTPIRQSHPDSLSTSVSTGNTIYQQGSQRFDVQLQSILRNTLGDSVIRIDSTHVSGVVLAQYSILPSQQHVVQATIQTDSIRLNTTSTGVSSTSLVAK
jgi:hypothetical protein